MAGPSRLKTLSSKVWGRPLSVGASALGLAVFGFFLVTAATADPYKWVVGVDRALYHDAAFRFLGDGSWYLATQVAGPYEIGAGDVLYPPIALFWLVPAAFLPDVLWWAVPAIVTGWIVWWHRPAPWSWPVMAACLAFPWSAVVIAAGNPVIWIVMFVAFGTRWPAAYALAFMKPSLFPFALLGIRERAWWITLGVLVSLSLALAPMWLDYLNVLVNTRGPMASVWYSAREVPLIAIPVIAWWARTRPAV
jgi:hypothetical protein